MNKLEGSLGHWDIEGYFIIWEATGSPPFSKYFSIYDLCWFLSCKEIYLRRDIKRVIIPILQIEKFLKLMNKVVHSQHCN